MPNSGTISPRSVSISWSRLRSRFPLPRLKAVPTWSVWMWAFASLSVTSTSKGKAGFHPGKRVRHQANHYARLRKRLQHKGTRGATRRLRRIEQRERRLKMQANHTIAKQIVEQHPHTLIGLENLTDIRERTKRKKRKRKKNGNGSEPVSPKARNANR